MEGATQNLYCDLIQPLAEPLAIDGVFAAQRTQPTMSGL